MNLSFHCTFFAALLLLQSSSAAQLRGAHEVEERRLNESGEVPVCLGGTFTPNTKKYYTIGTSSGLVWSAGSDSGGQVFENGIVLSDKKEAASSHWRFISQGSGKWQLRNRMTGMILDRDDATLELETLKAGSSTKFIARGKCSGSDRVIFSRNDNSKEAAFCPNNKCKKGSKIVVGSPYVAETKKTSCRYKAFLDHCSDYETEDKPVWVQSHYGKCGWLGGKRYRKCDRIGMRSLSTDPEEKWFVREVKTFTKPDIKAAPTLSIDIGTVDGYTDALVGVGLAVGGFVANNVVKNGAPGFGVVVSLTTAALHFGTGGGSAPSQEEILANLAREILDVVDFRINQVVIKNALAEAANLLDLVRKGYLIDYLKNKKSIFNTNGLPLSENEFFNLSGELEALGGDYEKAMAGMFPNPSEVDEDGKFIVNDINALRGQRAWPMMKLGMIEALMLYQEAVALDAFISFTFDGVDNDCEEIFNGHFNLGRIVGDFRDKLQKTRDMLVAYRTVDTLEEIQETYDCQRCQAGLGCVPATCLKTPIVKDTIRDIEFEGKRTLTNRWNSELKFDMIHLSYDTKKEADFFDSYEENTMALCNAMRTNSTLREIFAAAV